MSANDVVDSGFGDSDSFASKVLDNSRSLPATDPLMDYLSALIVGEAEMVLANLKPFLSSPNWTKENY